MSSGAKLPLAVAEELAREWAERLRPFCDRVEIAGSIRRRKAEVGDIEIVAIPRDPIGLFGLLYGKPRTKGKLPHEGGRYVQLLVPGPNGRVPLDLFWCDRNTWGLNFFIRTGSAEFTHAMATRSLQMGYVWHEARVYRRGLGGRPQGDPVPLPEEEDVFRFFGVRWVPPEHRTDAQALWRAVISAAAGAGEQP